MSPDELKETMDKLELNSSDVAIITGNTRRAVQLWLSGGHPVPQSTKIILSAMRAGLITTDWIVCLLTGE